MGARCRCVQHWPRVDNVEFVGGELVFRATHTTRLYTRQDADQSGDCLRTAGYRYQVASRRVISYRKLRELLVGNAKEKNETGHL